MRTDIRRDATPNGRKHMGKMQAEMVGDTFMLGPLEIPTAALSTLGQESVNKSGIVLVGQSGRKQVTIMRDGKPVMFTVSLYVQREPVNETEALAVHEAADEQKAKKQERELQEQQKRDREIKRATDLTRDILLDTRSLPTR